jgi:hypothetical protein
MATQAEHKQSAEDALAAVDGKSTTDIPMLLKAQAHATLATIPDPA